MKFFSTLAASFLGTMLALGILFFFFLIFVISLAASSEPAPRISRQSVLSVKINGAIPETVSGDPLFQVIADEPAFDLHDFHQAMDMAAVDPRIDAIWLKVYNVENGWASLNEIRTALLRFKTSGKPIIASTDDRFVSEDEYFVISAADSIFANPEALIEFNGFVIAGEFYKRAFDKLGIEAQYVRAGTYKGAVETFSREDFSADNEVQLQAILDNQNRIFFEAVGESRGLDPNQLDRLVKSRAMISSEQLAEAGLLDGVRYEDEVEALIAERLGYESVDDIKLVDIRRYARIPPGQAGLEQGNEQIALVYASGLIMPGGSGTGSPMGSSLGSTSFRKAMAEARDNDRIKAVVLRIDSPGGFAPAADAMLREITLTRETKPVVVSMGDVAASGGYWIATAADTVLADPLTITGSIGVFSVFFDAQQLVEDRLGITFDFIETSPHADMFSTVRPLSEQEIQFFQSSVDQTYSSFLEKVAAGTGMTTAEVDRVAQGRVWSGTDALAVGLIDGFGSTVDAISAAAAMAGIEEGGYRVKTLPRPRTFFEELTETMGTRATAIATALTTGPLEREFLENVRLVRRILAENGAVQARLPLDITIH